MKNSFLVITLAFATSIAISSASAQQCNTIDSDRGGERTPPPQSPAKSPPSEAQPKAATAAESKAPEHTDGEH